MNTDLQFTGYESEKATVKDFRPESLANDMPHPCDDCPLANLCAEEGTECAASRTFYEDGRWEFEREGKIIGVRGKFRR